MAVLSAPPTGTRATPYVWYVVWLLFTVNMLNYVDRMVLAVLIESIRLEIPMSDTQIGVLTGLAFAVFYAVAGLFIGRLADKMSRKRILMVSISVWSLATAACGLAGNFIHLLIARLAVGTGEAGSSPSSQSLLADYCNYRIRPAAYAIFAAGGTLGLTVGLAGGGFVADQLGWRAAFFVAGALGLPVVILLIATLRDPERGAQDGGAASMEDANFRQTMMTLFGRRSFVLIILASTCLAFVLFGVAQWVPVFLIRSYGLSPTEVGFFFGIAMGAGSAIGAIAGGVLCSRLVERDIDWLLLLPLLVGLPMVPLYFVVLYFPALPVALAAIFTVNVLGALGFGPMTASMHSVVPAGMRGTATAIYGLSTSLLGVGLAPFAIGLMSDLFGQGAQDATALRAALSVAVFVALGKPIFLYLARSSFRKNQVAGGAQ